VLLVRRAEGERWAGYWDFPRFVCDRAHRRPTAAELTRRVSTQTGISLERPRHRTTLRHTVTRFRITLECFEADCADSTRPREPAKSSWVRIAELDEYPLSTTGRRIARLLEE
jgi:A/G-specific adenine glycosylase